MVELLDLPFELVTLALSHLELVDLFHFGATCQYIRTALKLGNLIWLLEHGDGQSQEEREQVIRDSCPLVLSHALCKLMHSDRGSWHSARYEDLCRHGASFANVPHGQVLQEVFVRDGPGRRFRFMLRKGASIDQVERGIDGLLEHSLLRHGSGCRTDYLLAHGASLRNVPSGLNVLVEQLARMNRPKRINFIFQNCPLAYAPPRLRERYVDLYRYHGWSAELQRGLINYPDDLNILLGGMIATGDYRINDLLRRGASLHRVPQQKVQSWYRGRGIKMVILQGADPNAKELHENPLEYAVSNGLIAITEYLLEKGANTEIGRFGSTPLMDAAGNGHFIIAKLLVRNSANVNAFNCNGKTPLMLAAESGYVRTMSLLIDSGADISTTDHHGSTALHLAARSRSSKAVGYLLDKGLDVNVRNTLTGETPLFDAIQPRGIDTVKLLLESGADVNIKLLPSDYLRHRNYPHCSRLKKFYEFMAKNTTQVSARNEPEERTPLNLASACGSFGILKLLIAHGAKTNISMGNGRSAIEQAACHGHAEIVEELDGLDGGMDLIDRQNLLQIAAFYGHFSIFKYLCEKDVNLHPEDMAVSPLSIASVQGHAEIVSYLLERNLDFNTTLNGCTPLVDAASNGHLQVVRLLLQFGAGLVPPVKDGRSAIAAAIENQHIKVTRLLVENGVDVEERCGKLERTPLLIASICSSSRQCQSLPCWRSCEDVHTELVDVLLSHGANINAVDKQNCTPLFYAARQGHIEMTKMLLERGADHSISNNEGWSPLDIAISRNHQSIVSDLRQYGASR